MPQAAGCRRCGSCCCWSECQLLRLLLLLLLGPAAAAAAAAVAADDRPRDWLSVGLPMIMEEDHRCCCRCRPPAGGKRPVVPGVIFCILSGRHTPPKGQMTKG